MCEWGINLVAYEALRVTYGSILGVIWMPLWVTFGSHLGAFGVPSGPLRNINSAHLFHMCFTCVSHVFHMCFT